MRARVLTALVLIPLVLAAFAAPSPWVLFSVAAVAAYGCHREFAAMVGRNPNGFPFAPAFLFGLGAYGIADHRPAFGVAGLTVLAVGGLLAAIAHAKSAEHLVDYGFAGFWYSAPFVALAAAHAVFLTPEWSMTRPALLAIVPLWAGDTAGIFVGKAIGRKPLAPAISPNKTVAGAVGNAVACVLVGAILAPAIGLRAVDGVVCGAICGLLGQAGDLAESWIKRQRNVKDSGALLPGHGGLLDRVDSLLLSSPFVAAYLVLFAGAGR